MSQSKELIKLLEKEILPEINDYIDDLFEVIASKKDTPEIKEELQNTQEMKSDFLAMLDEAKNDELDEEEIEAILEEIKEMREE